jgi:anti-sigma factor RsiW
MNCKAAEKILVAYLDGRTDPGRRREMEAHLAECQSCRGRARQFGELWGILDELPVLAPSLGFDAAVRARIAQEPHRAGPWGWLVVPSPRLAIGVTALLVFSIWLSSLPRVQRPSPGAFTGIEAEFRMIEDLPMLEDYDVLLNFEALSELPVQPVVKQPSGI